MILSAIKLARQTLMVCLTVLWACASVSAEKQPTTESVGDLMRRGVSAENSQRMADAAAAYEKLLQRDTTFEATVAPRLVNLYLSMNQPAPALSWATRVARRHPEPKAYLAGVHSRLNQHKEAELLLRQALRETREPMRRVPLLWQLAETQESQSDSQSAMTTLANAHDATKHAGLRQTSTLRIKALRQRLATARAQQANAGNQHQVEDQP